MAFRHRLQLALVAPATGALLALAAPAEAGDTSFTRGAGTWNWNTGGNWSSGVPLVGDTVYIGNLAQVENDFVKLNSDVGPFSLIEVTDGMKLDTNGHRLLMSSGTLTASGENQDGQFIYSSGLSLRESGFDIDSWLYAIYLSNDADLRLSDGTKLQISEYMELISDSMASGAGTINFINNDPADVALNNLGYISGQPGTMYLNQNGAAKFDLDGIGDTGHSGARLSASVNRIEPPLGTTVIVNGTALTDEFDGELYIGLDGRIEMNLSSGWTLGPDGIVTFLGGSNDYPVLAGDTMTVYGDIEADARNSAIECNVVIHNGAHTTVHENDSLTFTGNTVANTTLFTVNDGGTLNFAGPSNLTNNGYDLYGGSMTGAIIQNTNTYGINGYGVVDNRIINDGRIYASDGGTLLINGTHNDWDGINGDGELRAWGGTLHITDTLDASFDGEIRIFQDSAMVIDDFVLTLTPSSYAYFWNSTLISNERQKFGGEVDIISTVEFNTDVDLLSTTQVGIGERLNLNQNALVEAGASISGGLNSLLVGGQSGTLTFENGAVIDVDVQGQGTTIIDANFGEATVNDNFYLLGTLQLQLGPPPIGQFDHLNVADTFEARGHISVVMLNYQPQLGDAFDVLDFTTFIDLGYTMSLPILPANLAWDTSTFEVDGILAVIVDTCPTDLNKDGMTNVLDLLIMLGEWGPVGIQSDFNEDGVVNVLDLLHMLGAWGGC